MVLTLADHEVQDIGEVWFDTLSIPPDYLDASGNVIAGHYSGFVRIKKHLGTTSQTADSDLIAETTAGVDFRGRGVAYLYIRLKHDRDIFPQGIPTITAFVKGRKVLDARDSTTKYTQNVALMTADYLTAPLDSLTAGVGVSTSAVDSTDLIAAANVCDEFVTTSTVSHTIQSADATSDILTLTAVNDRLAFQTGDRVVLTGGSLPTGLATATNYYCIPYQRIAGMVDGVSDGKVRIKLASTLQNAFDGVAVNITGTGTGTISKTAEPRYHGGGVLDTSDTPESNLKELLTGMGGTIIYVGGAWHIKAAAYAAPVFTFDEGHLISGITVSTAVSRAERFNIVKGTYVSPLNDGQASDYPPVQNSTYLAADNGRALPADYDLPFTQRPCTAQRLAKIRLEKHRQEIVFEAQFNMHAMQVQPYDTVLINNTRLGWSAKPFEVIQWELATQDMDGAPLLYVKMTLRETASECYDWNNGEETSVDPAKNTLLPSALYVAPPTGLFITSNGVFTETGDLSYEFIVSWDAPDNSLITNGGHYDIEFKRSSEATWGRSYRAEDEDTSVPVKQVDANTLYDVRIRSVNALGVRSQYQQLLGFTVGSPAGATTRLDYKAITEGVTISIDYGTITGSVSTSLDYGSIT
jgi:hypothetical protein